MSFIKATKDGGPESRVWMYGIEVKGLFSVLLLRFDPGSRPAYHSHAFNAVSWLLSGALVERVRLGRLRTYWPSVMPIWTPRECFHQVVSIGRSWVLTFRGPWADTWEEETEEGRITLTGGRRVVR
jgi:hypothetical protein